MIGVRLTCMIHRNFSNKEKQVFFIREGLFYFYMMVISTTASNWQHPSAVLVLSLLEVGLLHPASLSLRMH